MSNKKLIVIVGPTAAKKSKLAHLIAERFSGSVINGDAYQIYKEINVGINKPTLDEIKKYDYHLVNMISYKDEWSICHFQKAFEEAYNDITKKNRIPILCGGSHLYTDCIVNGYDLSIDTSKYDEEIKTWSNEELYEYIKKYDLESATKIGINNYKRLYRCVLLLKANNNKPKSLTDKQNNSPKYNCLVIMVNKDREILYKKINERFDEMYKDEKWINEIKSLLTLDKNIVNSLSFKAIGYTEIANALLTNTEVNVDLLKKKTRNLAKRQLTWCNNKFPNKLVFDFDTDDINKLYKKIEEFYYD